MSTNSIPCKQTALYKKFPKSHRKDKVEFVDTYSQNDYFKKSRLLGIVKALHIHNLLQHHPSHHHLFTTLIIYNCYLGYSPRPQPNFKIANEVQVKVTMNSIDH
eukprot:TRINITY_DN12597_c1_g1_i2.p1 TRINITY_DN12597_c1_g1~~TRINITY_DN12597_c1_g1_i2.p1  ORF type:complete len:104 (-),score=2.22 TRINITY_DN12597_c1_g1_i2:422-733(-)